MPRARRKLWEWIDAEPKRAFMSLEVIADGGDIRHDKVSRVRQATIRAFASACEAEGLRQTWEVRARSMSPKSLVALLVRKGLLSPTNTELDQTADAVDPHAGASNA